MARMSSRDVPAVDDRPAFDHRALRWEGVYNARDLGGLPTVDGEVTRSRSLVRSADLRYATEEALVAMQAHGIGTVLDLRNDFETRLEPKSPEEAQANAHRVPPTPEPPMPEGVFAVRVPLDDTADTAFWARMREEGRLGSPRFFRPVIEEHPRRVVAVLRTIAKAPGGVLYHCAIGRDRTGLTTFALLALAGVEPEAIVDDYVRSVEELRPFFARMDFPDPSGWVEENLAKRGFTLEDALAEQLDGFDARAALSRAGLEDAELDALVARLRG